MRTLFVASAARQIVVTAPAKLAAPRFKMSYKLDLSSLQSACRELYFRPNQVPFSQLGLNYSQVTFENTTRRGLVAAKCGFAFLHLMQMIPRQIRHTSLCNVGENIEIVANRERAKLQFDLAYLGGTIRSANTEQDFQRLALLSWGKLPWEDCRPSRPRLGRPSRIPMHLNSHVLSLSAGNIYPHGFIKQRKVCTTTYLKHITITP